MTDLDLSVLKGIVKSLTAALSTPAAAAPGGSTPADGSADTSGAANAAGGPVTYALNQAQRRTVAGLRGAFRRADVNGDGSLDRREVESLLRNHLKGQNLDVAQREAEVAQFIGSVETIIYGDFFLLCLLLHLLLLLLLFPSSRSRMLVMCLLSFECEVKMALDGSTCMMPAAPCRVRGWHRGFIYLFVPIVACAKCVTFDFVYNLKRDFRQTRLDTAGIRRVYVHL